MNINNSKSPIFIVGTPRSGTTLMAKILGRHSRLFMPGETHFFDDVYAFRKSFGNLDNPDTRECVASKLADHYKRYWEIQDQERIDSIIRNRPEQWNQWRDGMHEYRDALSGFMELQMELEGKYRWGNNAPIDIFNIEEILSFYSDAKFIICVRDPRDFLLSYKGKWHITGEEHVERLRKLYHPVITSLLWKSSMRQLPWLKSKIPQGNWLIVRYEDLVTITEDTVRRVCDTIGEHFEAQILEVRENNSSADRQQQGIFSTSIERWRHNLDPAEIAVAQHLIGVEMAELAYTQENISAPMMALASIYLGAPWAFVRAMRANAEMRGPLIPYLARRIKCLLGR